MAVVDLNTVWKSLNLIVLFFVLMVFMLVNTIHYILKHLFCEIILLGDNAYQLLACELIRRSSDNGGSLVDALYYGNSLTNLCFISDICS